MVALWRFNIAASCLCPTLVTTSVDGSTAVQGQTKLNRHSMTDPWSPSATHAMTVGGIGGRVLVAMDNKHGLFDLNLADLSSI